MTGNSAGDIGGVWRALGSGGAGFWLVVELRRFPAEAFPPLPFSQHGFVRDFARIATELGPRNGPTAVRQG